ncbi:MAG: UMP kinase [Oscillospiraceae bacterium]
MEIKYKRILLKLSGEALAGNLHKGLDYETLVAVCKSVKKCLDLGVEVGIVVGGGNFWRGRASIGQMERTRADKIGMLATVMNSLALADAFQSIGVTAIVRTAVDMLAIAPRFTREDTLTDFASGRVVIFGGGTGSPFFSTDTTAALRAAEIDADAILMAKMVDGVYDSDPKINKNAVRYDKISFSEILSKDLKVIDSTAASMCRDNSIPVFVFSLEDTENILRAVKGENIGTILKEEK